MSLASTKLRWAIGYGLMPWGPFLPNVLPMVLHFDVLQYNNSPKATFLLYDTSSTND
jgi:hypothetical protein